MWKWSFVVTNPQRIIISSEVLQSFLVSFSSLFKPISFPAAGSCWQ